MDKEEYRYEIALSYSHKNKNVAAVVADELEKVFGDKFGYDEGKPEEFATAQELEDILKKMFRKARHAVVLFSEEYYREGSSARKELDEILCKAHDEGQNNFFIINLDSTKGTPLEGLNYIRLRIDNEADETGNRPVIECIVNDRIKRSLIIEHIQRTKEEGVFKLNIQTLFVYGNTPQWKSEYDWNILTPKFIDTTNGRRIREGHSWLKFWTSIKEDFTFIKERISEFPDMQRVIRLNSHLSIAYKLGQLYGDIGRASGNRNLLLLNSQGERDIEFAINKVREKKRVNINRTEQEGNDKDSSDVVCIVSIKSSDNMAVVRRVEEYLTTSGVGYRDLYLFQQVMVIEGGDGLEDIAEYLHDAMHKCLWEKEVVAGKSRTVHLFLDTLAPLAFVLGGKSVSFSGEVKLYEYMFNEAEYVYALDKSM